MENHQISVYVPVTKNYSVNRISVRGGTYNGDSSGLAQWYYTNIDPTSNNIIIHIPKTIDIFLTVIDTVLDLYIKHNGDLFYLLQIFVVGLLLLYIKNIK